MAREPGDDGLDKEAGAFGTMALSSTRNSFRRALPGIVEQAVETPTDSK